MNKSIKKLIVTNIIKSQVENMINYIYYKYPKIIDNKTRLKLIEIYTNQFIVNDKLNEKEKGSSIKRIKKKILNRNKIKINIPIKKIKNQCEGRTWGNGIITKDNYGSRCSRVKIKDKIYCNQHNKFSKHGNFFQDPPQDVIKEYIKFNK